MSKHTPGPWRLGDEKHGDFYIWGPDPAAYGYVAQANACGSKTNPREEREANARLITAAPELLEACEAFAGAMRRGDKVELLHLIDALKLADAAITKATGE